MRRSKSFFRWTIGLLLLAALGAGALGGAGLSVRAAPRQQAATNVVISEFRTNGPNGGNDEFIELYNPTNSSICIEDWQLRVLTGTGNEAVRATIPAGVAIGADQHYLIANSNATGGYSGTYDYSYTTGIVDTGGVAIFDGNNTRIDSVGLNATSIYTEGTFLNPLTGNQNRSYQRQIDSGTGIYIDTNNNLNDFQEINPSAPENSVGLSVTCSIPPLSVIINEVAWMGTLASPDDDWIELYNPSTTVVDISGWDLIANNFSITFPPNTSIPGNGYFLIERRELVTDEPYDLLYSGLLLSNTGDFLRLRAPDGTLVDTANSDGGAWPAGTTSPNGTMERMGVIADATLAWVTNVNAPSWTNTDAAGQPVHGTPGRLNWGFGVTHTPIPPTPTGVTPLSVVINEVAWAGTLSSSNDEWIELYNASSQNISLTGWTLRAADGSPSISLSGTIASGDYYLLERTDEDTTDVQSDLIFTGAISNTSEILRLFDQNGYVVDRANENSGAWPAGNASTYSSMQRSVINTDSDFVWVTYDASSDSGTKAKDASGNTINGTPGRGNAPINVTPTATPRNTAIPGGGSSGGSTGGSTGGTTELPPILGISEFLPRPGHDWNKDGQVDIFDEFIEIINAGQIDVNLGGYSVDDEQGLGSSSYTLPDITLKPGERVIFYASETGILLSDAGDTVRLLRGSSTVVDAHTYGVVGYPDLSWCRIPDRLGYWNDPCFPTPGNANALTGTFPLPSGPAAGYHPPVCLLPDTTPGEFVYAECEASGNGIWSRQYWDSADASERLKLDEVWKGETVFE